MKQFVNLMLAAMAGSILTLGLHQHLQPSPAPDTTHIVDTTPVHYASHYIPMNMASTDFTTASLKSVEAVVHIKSTAIVNKVVYNYRRYNNPIDEFFGFGGDYYLREPQQKQERRQSSGSGVIVRNDGYIVTNNHVIDGADELEVILNDNRSFIATVVGRDASTDLAVLKIEGSNLPYLEFADSDNISIGEWVLAVGNPFNLSSTVTAGIVSAKARSINILKDKAAIESFIQTDAAVNPGNSGGALVNLQGNLIGINTAIASPNGAFAGYSFAVPSNIVRKVMDDLVRYGIVQRAFLGVQVRELNDQLAREHGLSHNRGILLHQIIDGGAAQQAMLKPNDIVLAINGQSVRQTSAFLELIGRHRPGDTVQLTIWRNKKEITLTVVLKNSEGTNDLLKNETEEVLQMLGIRIDDLSAENKRNMKLNQGVQVKEIAGGKVRTHTNMQEGFIITQINNTSVKNKTHFIELLKQAGSGILIEGIYPGYNGKYYYALGL